MNQVQRVILIILDGWGHGVVRRADAIAQANVPFINGLYQQYPNAELVTFGEAVGLPEGQMGNSEVGHLNIGAGRIVYQELTRISKSIRDGEFHQNPVLLQSLTAAKQKGSKVHFIGLVSDGGVHSHTSHLRALCDVAVAQGLENVFIHAFTDGRDTDPKSGLSFVQDLEKYIAPTPVKIASVIGRYYAMDRDKRWERVELAYDLLVKGEGEAIQDISAAIQNSYAAGITDEFLKPMFVADAAGNPIATIEDGDTVICFNFRTDRPREITEVLCQQDFPEHDMYKKALNYVSMTRYDDTYQGVEVLFRKDDLSMTLGEVLSNAGMTQVRIAETEKYPHVTFFFSGGREEEFPGERRLLVPSPKVATYDMQPSMSAEGITQSIIADIVANQPNFICLNYANTDMVGHTGVFNAVMEAAETVDACTKRLIETALAHQYEAIIIADHGNSDFMINEDGSPNTAHSTNMVPIFYVSPNAEGKTIKSGKLADVAPTILGLMGIEAPSLMDGDNLISAV